MPKKWKNKDKVIEEDLYMEILPRMETIYEDTKFVTGAEPEFKWGQIYHMIKDQSILDAFLEDISLYENIIYRKKNLGVSEPRGTLEISLGQNVGG